MKTQGLASAWIPATLPSGRLVIVLHGRGDSPAGFRWLPEAMGLPDVNFLLVQAPDPYYTGYSWYDLPPNQGPGILRSRSLLDTLMSEVMAGGFQTKDIILFGFSQGCLMTLEWGGRTNLEMAGFIAISGYCYDPKKLGEELSETARKAHWLVTHGILDGTLDYAVTQAQVKYLIGAGLPLEFHSFVKEHTIDDNLEIPLLRTFMRERFAR